MTNSPICPQCGRTAQLWQASRVYGPGWEGTPLWGCDCTEGLHYVGCHPGTVDPLGTLADRGLRQLRRIVHDRLDPIWKEGPYSRNQVYFWLAEAMGIPPAACHIALFDRKQCITANNLLKGHPYHVARKKTPRQVTGNIKGR